MGRGLSKLQTAILGLIDGTVRSKVYGGAEAFGTPELMEELEAMGLLDDSTPRKQKVFTVRRACDSLFRRGLIQGTYRKGHGLNESRPSYAIYIEWEATPKKGKKCKRKSK